MKNRHKDQHIMEVSSLYLSPPFSQSNPNGFHADLLSVLSCTFEKHNTDYTLIHITKIKSGSQLPLKNSILELSINFLEYLKP